MLELNIKEQLNENMKGSGDFWAGLDDLCLQNFCSQKKYGSVMAFKLMFEYYMTKDILQAKRIFVDFSNFFLDQNQNVDELTLGLLKNKDKFLKEIAKNKQINLLSFKVRSISYKILSNLEKEKKEKIMF